MAEQLNIELKMDTLQNQLKSVESSFNRISNNILKVTRSLSNTSLGTSTQSSNSNQSIINAIHKSSNELKNVLNNISSRLNGLNISQQSSSLPAVAVGGSAGIIASKTLSSPIGKNDVTNSNKLLDAFNKISKVNLSDRIENLRENYYKLNENINIKIKDTMTSLGEVIKNVSKDISASLGEASKIAISNIVAGYNKVQTLVKNTTENYKKEQVAFDFGDMSTNTIGQRLFDPLIKGFGNLYSILDNFNIKTKGVFFNITKGAYLVISKIQDGLRNMSSIVDDTVGKASNAWQSFKIRVPEIDKFKDDFKELASYIATQSGRIKSFTSNMIGKVPWDKMSNGGKKMISAIGGGIKSLSNHFAKWGAVAINVTNGIIKRLAKLANRIAKFSLNQLSKGFNQLKNAAKRSMSFVGTSIDGLISRFATFGKYLIGLGAASLAGLIYGVKKVADEAQEIKTLSTTLGLTTEQLQKLNMAAIASGSSSDKMGDALKDLQQKIEEARMGTGDLNTYMSDLNLGKDFFSKDFNTQVMEFSDALSNIDDSGRRAYIGMKILGKKNTEIVNIFTQGSANLDQFNKKLGGIGIISHSAIKSLTELRASFGVLGQASKSFFAGFGEAVSSVFTPAINDMISSSSNMGEKLEMIGKTLASFLIESLHNLIKILPNVISFIKSLVPAINLIVQSVVKGFTVIITVASQSFKNLQTMAINFVNNFNSIMGNLGKIASNSFDVAKMSITGSLDVMYDIFTSSKPLDDIHYKIAALGLKMSSAAKKINKATDDTLIKLTENTNANFGESIIASLEKIQPLLNTIHIPDNAFSNLDVIIAKLDTSLEEYKKNLLNVNSNIEQVKNTTSERELSRMSTSFSNNAGAVLAYSAQFDRMMTSYNIKTIEQKTLDENKKQTQLLQQISKNSNTSQSVVKIAELIN